MKEKIDRTSRESQERKERTKSWTPPSSLDAPPAPKGFKHRWIRTETIGFMDPGNVSKNQIGEHDYPVVQSGQYQGLIGVGGLVLARIPEEVVEQRKKYFQNVTADQVKSVDNDILREQRPEMPVNIDRQSRVSFGGSRKK
jgi:hypothetical protein